MVYTTGRIGQKKKKRIRINRILYDILIQAKNKRVGVGDDLTFDILPTLENQDKRLGILPHPYIILELCIDNLLIYLSV